MAGHGCESSMRDRRTAIPAGTIGLLGVGMNDAEALWAAAPATSKQRPKTQACVSFFLSGRNKGSKE